MFFPRNVKLNDILCDQACFLFNKRLYCCFEHEVIMQSHMNTPKSNGKREFLKANRKNDMSTSFQTLAAVTQMRSPDSTITEADCFPTSSTHSVSATSSNSTEGMSEYERPNSPPRKEMSPSNSRSTPQSTPKNNVKCTSKRKLFTSRGAQEDDGSSADGKSTPRRKKVDHTTSTPKSSARLSVPFSERQQMAMVMQMTAKSSTEDPQNFSTSSIKSPKESGQNRKLNKRNEKGETPLHSATIKGDVKLVKKLIRQGADVNISDFAGWTPLHEACNIGWVEIAKVLLRAGATVNVKGGDSDTPLHDASINGHQKVVELLVKSGANPSLANTSGKTAIDIAKNDEIRGILKQEIIPSSSDDSSNEELRSPTSPESNAEEIILDEGNENVHSTCYHPVDDGEVHASTTDPEIAGTSEYKEIETLDTAQAEDNSCNQGPALSTMRKTSPQQNNSNKGPEKPSSPRLTLRFQSVKNKELKSNPVGSTSKCLTGIVSSTEPKYQSYFVTMEPKDDVYEFKQDTPPPVPLSAGRTANLLASVSEACDSQTEPADVGKDCDSSSTVDRSTNNNVSSNSGNAISVKNDSPDIGFSQSSINATISPKVDCPFKSEASSVGDEESLRKRRKESNSPDLHSVVSSTSKSSVAGTTENISSSPTCDDSSLTSKLLAVGSSADATSSTDKNTTDIPSVSSSLSPPISVGGPGSSNGGSGSSSPKVPPLKIVIPQSSEQDSKDKTKTNNLRQALPYVVNSTAAGDMTETIIYGTSSNSQTTDCARVTFSKLSEIQSTNNEVTPERTSQRVTRSLHRMQAAMANVNQSGTEISNEATRSCDAQEDLPPQNMEVHPRKRKLRSRDLNSSGGNNNNIESYQSSASSTSSHEDQPVLNSYHMFLDIRRQVNERRQNLMSVQPKAPQGFKDYLINKCSYAIEGNYASRTAVPMLSTPQSLTGALKDLYEEQERARYSLRLQQLVEREKLILSAEQEVLRVYTRAARASVNQIVPLSMCTILKDEEIYNSLENEQEEKDKNVRSRYNGRLFISWIQDVNDKWDRIKAAMLLRHHNEAEALHAVQKMSWEWKMKDLGVCDAKTTPVIDNIIVPMVYVNDEFDVLPG